MNTIIDNATYKKDFQPKQGSLSFPDELWDCKFYVDIKKLKKEITLPKGVRILKILITTELSPEFENKVNKQITYKSPLYVSENHPEKEHGKYGTVAWNPVGKAWIVISKTPEQKPKKPEQKKPDDAEPPEPPESEPEPEPESEPPEPESLKGKYSFRSVYNEETKTYKLIPTTI